MNFFILYTFDFRMDKRVALDTLCGGKSSVKQRNINLDLIRCIAVLFVISVHFCLNIGFYELPCSGMRMLFLSILRSAFMTCVPLFLMLTGYLMNKKELTLSYYKGMKKTYCIYVLICICCLLFRIFYEHENIGIRKMILSILDFSADSYAWYIEMYIGLFLLIPFLNILWNNMEDKAKKWLLITFLILTTLPSLLNCWEFLLPGDETRDYNLLFPDYWQSLYPFTYYFIGAYLKEGKREVRLLRESVILVGLTVLFGIFNYYRSYNDTFEWIAANNYQGIQVVIISVLLFRILSAVPLKNCPNIAKKGIQLISELSLGIYLASYISDRLIYPILTEHVTEMVRRMDYFPVMIISSFGIALIISFFVNKIYHILEIIFNCIRQKYVKIS